MQKVMDRTALHEAGHLLADYLLGLGPFEVDLATERGGATFSCVAPHNTRFRIPLAVSLFSGAAAEREMGFDDEATKTGETSDLHHIEKLKLSSTEHEDCLKTAKELMSTHRERIGRIAEGLGLRTVTRGPDLYRLLDHPLPAGCWFGRVECDASGLRALVTFDGPLEEGLTEVRATALDPHSADRLRDFAGCSGLFMTGYRIGSDENDESQEGTCSASLDWIRHQEGLIFVLQRACLPDWV